MASVAVGKPFFTTEGQLPPEYCPPAGYDSVIGEVGEKHTHTHIHTYVRTQEIGMYGAMEAGEGLHLHNDKNRYVIHTCLENCSRTTAGRSGSATRNLESF